MVITQESLALDTRVKFDEDPDVQAMVKREAELVADINTFSEALLSAREELVSVRKKLRPLRKKNGLNKTGKSVITEFVKQNPECSYAQISAYMLETFGHSHSSIGSFVEQALSTEHIIYTEKGYILGKPKKMPHGSIANLLFEYAKSVQWFKSRDCTGYFNSKGLPIRSTVLGSYLYHVSYIDKFDVDNSERVRKFRLKDEYRGKGELL